MGIRRPAESSRRCEQRLREAEWRAGGPVPDEEQMQRLLADCPEWFRRMQEEAAAAPAETRAKRDMEEAEPPQTPDTEEPDEPTSTPQPRSTPRSSRRQRPSPSGGARPPSTAASRRPRLSTTTVEPRGGSTPLQLLSRNRHARDRIRV